MMPIGQMDRLVSVKKLVETRDDTTKTVTHTWQVLADVFMAMRPARGRERFASEQLSASGDTVWTMHYRADMDPESVDVPKSRQLSFRGRTYEIVGAVHVGMREAIELVTIASSRVA